MRIDALRFPTQPPTAYEYLEDEPRFRPEEHLDLGQPEQVWTLEDFGYDERDIVACASPVAVTSPFRLLSEAGAAAAREVALKLQAGTIEGTGARVPSFVAGAVYKSRFVRDLCASPEIAEHLSGIARTELAPHSMPSQQAYINYAPADISKAVDAWHHDGIGFDYVLMLSDPRELKGGRFEYFTGTRDEFARRFSITVPQIRAGVTSDLPAERVVSVEFPAAGYALFQQGNMVVHRAARLLEPGERITMVPGYVALDVSAPDPTATHDMPYYEEPGIYAELARHSAWLARAKLSSIVDGLPMDLGNRDARSALREAVRDVEAAIEALDNREANVAWRE